jgi:hypothetical protein
MKNGKSEKKLGSILILVDVFVLINLTFLLVALKYDASPSVKVIH